MRESLTRAPKCTCRGTGPRARTRVGDFYKLGIYVFYLADSWSPDGGAFCEGVNCSSAWRGIVFGRLAASRSHRRVTTCTPRRRGVPFVRTRRRGLCSMSGRYPYGIGNPPTLRRSSFPQRALRPAGDPNQNTLGAVPQDPLTLKLRLDTLSRCLRRILFWLCRNRIKITPYKRRLIPFQEAALWLSGRDVPTRYGFLGRSPK